MDTELEYDFSSAPMEVAEPAMPKDNALECIVCHTELTYGGRGPKPKYCDNHKRKSTSNGPKRPRKKSGTDYREGIEGLLQLPAAALAVVGSQTDKQGHLTHPEFLADASAIADAAPKIASAVSDLANDRPEVAAVLDKILKVGPYGALITAVLPLAAQILTNHRVIPAGLLGAKSLEDQFAASVPDAG